MRLILLAVLLLVPFAAVARADILYLEGGGQVEGVVTEGTKTYRVAMVSGTTEVLKSKAD